MKNPLMALYACYLAIVGSFLYIAWQGTESGNVGKPCLDAMIKIRDVVGDPVAMRLAQQDQEQKCMMMMKYDVAVSHMIPAPK